MVGRIETCAVRFASRHIARPPVATERLALADSGHIRHTLKTPYRDGTTHVMFEPEDFIARLAALGG